MKPHYKLSKPCGVCGCEYQYQSRPVCVECCKKKTKEYYQANKQKCLDSQKRWVRENRQYVRHYHRAYYEMKGANHDSTA